MKKKFLFSIITFLFIAFIYCGNVSAKVLGTIYSSNDNRSSQYNNRTNLLEEFKNNSKLSVFLAGGSKDFKQYFVDKIRNTSDYYIDYTDQDTFISVFTNNDLDNFAIGSDSQVIDYTIKNQCNEYNCKYVFITSKSISYNGYWFSHNLSSDGRNVIAVYYFDSDMNVVGSYKSDTAIRYYYWAGSEDFTGLLNLFLYRIGSYGLTNYDYEDLVIQNLNVNGTTYNLNNSSGRNGFSNFFYNLFNKDKGDIDSDNYQLLSNDYIKYPLVRTNGQFLPFMSTVFVNENSMNVPLGFDEVLLSSYTDGIYLVPTLDSSCTTDGDYAIYYYSDLVRWEQLNYILLNRNYNILGNAYLVNLDSYTMSGFTLIGDLVTFENMNDRIFYFHQQFGAESIHMFYNSTCLHLVAGNSKSNVTYQDLTFNGTLTNKLSGIESPNYYPSSGLQQTTWSDKEKEHEDFVKEKEDNLFGSVGDIIKNGVNNLTGFFSSVSSVVTMITSFLTGLPSEIYTIFLSCFSIGMIVLILKIFL